MGASLERSDHTRGATWDDLEHVVRVLAVPEEHLRTAWDLPSFEVGRDNWLAGRAGYASVSPAGELTLAAPTGAVADELLARATARARERGLALLSLRTTAGDDVNRHLVERHRFRLQTDVLAMARLIGQHEPAPHWPDGIVVRTFAPADSAAVQSLLDEAYGDWDSGHVPLGHDDWERSMTGDAEFDPTVWWLAERGGALAGCALWWSSGWLKDVVVREGERGHGLGEALIRQGLSEFARRGVARAGLKVDAANPTGAVRLYERLGFVTERREQIWALSL